MVTSALKNHLSKVRNISEVQDRLLTANSKKVIHAFVTAITKYCNEQASEPYH